MIWMQLFTSYVVIGSSGVGKPRIPRGNIEGSSNGRTNAFEAFRESSNLSPSAKYALVCW